MLQLLYLDVLKADQVLHLSSPPYCIVSVRPPSQRRQNIHTTPRPDLSESEMPPPSSLSLDRREPLRMEHAKQIAHRRNPNPSA
jgi:hypothetical protein